MRRYRAVPRRPIDYRPAVHALAVGPSRQKIPDIAWCDDTERVWEVTKRDALCTHWLSGLPDVKWPLTVQLTTLTIKGHFMKLLGSVICVTSLSAVYMAFCCWNASVWHFHMFDFSISIWTEDFWKPLKRSVLLCAFILPPHFAIFKTQYCINSQNRTCSTCKNRQKWQITDWQTAKGRVIMTANGALW